jgi:hypothetical protein
MPILTERQYNCPNCAASCTFEAMQMCNSIGACPTVEFLENGTITDRRPTDLDPTFPSELTYVCGINGLNTRFAALSA